MFGADLLCKCGTHPPFRLDKHVYAAGNTAKLNLEFQTTGAFTLKVKSLVVKVNLCFYYYVFLVHTCVLFIYSHHLKSGEAVVSACLVGWLLTVETNFQFSKFRYKIPKIQN